jgi:hypothetical protein
MCADSLNVLTSVGVIAKSFLGINCEPKARVALMHALRGVC